MTGREKELAREFVRAMVFVVLLVLCAFAVLDACAAPAPLGIANSNGGNIRSHNWKWWKKLGAVGVDPWHHLIFATDADGLRALGFVLHGYKRKGFNTIELITARWVGPSHKEAAVRGRYGYMSRLCQDLGLKPTDLVDMDDPYTMAVLARAIVYAENGRDPYPWSMYETTFGVKP